MTKPRAADRITDKYLVAKVLQGNILPHIDYVHEMIDPQRRPASRIPDEVPARTAMFSAPEVQDVDSGGVWNSSDGSYAVETIGESFIAVKPGIKGSIWSTHGVNTTIVYSGTDEPLYPSFFDNQITDITLTESAFARTALINGTHGILPRGSSIPTLQGAPVYTALITPGVPDDTLRFNLTMFADNGYRRRPSILFADNQMSSITYHLYTKHADLVWYTQTVISTDLSTAINVATIDRGAILAWAARAHMTDNVRSPMKYLSAVPVGQLAQSATIVLQSSDVFHFRITDFSALANISEASKERTSALSMLVTYTGTDLANGGNLAIARVQPGFTPAELPLGDLYGFLSQLPYDTYNGAMKNGGYSWWVPFDEQELQFTHHMAECHTTEETNLWCYFTRSDATQSVRLTANIHVECITTSPRFLSLVGPVNPQFSILLAIAKALPAATENDLHSLLSKVWKDVKGVLSKPKTWQDLFKYGTGAVKAFLEP